MYIGIAGMMPPDIRQVDEKTVVSIRQAGFTGVSCRFRAPLTMSPNDVDQLRSVLDAGSVQAAQAVAQHEDLVNPDTGRRREGIKAMQVMCSIARRLGAGNLCVRPGSLNPAGPWYPHPENRSPETTRRLIASLKEVAAAAEAEGVPLAMEGHVLSPLYSVQAVKHVIESVGSEALGFNMDPVNFVGSLPAAYDTTSLINHLFDMLGPYTVCAHAKDFFIQDRLVLHIEEAMIGQGLMDYTTFLSRYEECCPNGYVLIEHLTDEQVPKARSALDRIAQVAGLMWKQPA